MRWEREITCGIFVILCSVAKVAAAHQCNLDGNSADAIQIYNTCIADLLNVTANHEVAHKDG